MNGLPDGYCAAKAKLNLDVQQWGDMAHQDRTRAKFSQTKLARSNRHLAQHLAACGTCGGA